MTASPVRFGVLGAGWFASRRHIPDIARNEGATLVALCRRDAERLAAVAEHFGVERTYTDWRTMLHDCPLDAVLISSPHALHYEQSMAAIDRGLHVLVEKPMALDPGQARTMVEAARRQGVLLAVALNPPHWSHCHLLRDAVRRGDIGDIESISILNSGNASFVFGEAPRPPSLPGVVEPTMYRADPALCGGGHFVDGGSHLVSLALWITGLRVRAVAAIMDALPSDRRASVTLSLGSNATAAITSIGNSASESRRVAVVLTGSKGAAWVDGPEFATRIERQGVVETLAAERDLPAVPGPVANLVDAVRGRGGLLSPGEHGVEVVEVVSAAYEAARSGRVIELTSV